MIQTVLEHAGYYHFAEVGLVLFGVVFVMVVINALRRSKSEIADLARMALEPDENETTE